jgi:hypothetical protein
MSIFAEMVKANGWRGGGGRPDDTEFGKSAFLKPALRR